MSTDAIRPSWNANSFLSVRFVPSWFPGAGFKRKARAWGKRYVELENLTHSWAMKQIVSNRLSEITHVPFI